MTAITCLRRYSQSVLRTAHGTMTHHSHGRWVIVNSTTTVRKLFQLKNPIGTLRKSRSEFQVSATRMTKLRIKSSSKTGVTPAYATKRSAITAGARATPSISGSKPPFTSSGRMLGKIT